MFRSAPVFRCLAASVLLAAGHLPASAQSASPLDVDLGPGINEAFVSQLGENQRASIEQRNIRGGLISGRINQTGSGNEARMLMQGGLLSGGIDQSGSDNKADMLLEGSDLSGAIAQDGDRNTGTLEVRGHHNRGVLQQSGSDLTGGLIVEGQGTEVIYSQSNSAPGQTAPVTIGSDTPTGMPIIVRQY